MPSSRRRLLLLSVVLGLVRGRPAGGGWQPPAAPTYRCAVVARASTSVDISTTPSPTTFAAAGHLSHLGAVTATGDELFTPLGLPPVIPYTLMGTETLVAANGDELLGTVHGTGVNNSGSTSGTNVVTITGGTGRFADASGSYTETYTGEITSQIGTIVSGPVHARRFGDGINLNKRSRADR